ncbi:Ser/Thr protein phosphatase family protein [Brugia malayi]|uniref:Serine/threonine-protein phosphatase n=1 Tax=Brugia malayi TaxID=6279 RepID=A0A4E9FTM1_BRUMA|nr:Ser/Thr protein phosphatase family protein [Brugia malayi]VIP00151.1 Ser/Thr protein phosphatase family protein [Brugia malayi]
MLDENEATQKTEMEESRKIIKGKKSGKPPIMKEMNKPPLVKEMSTEKKLVLRELIKKHLLAGSTRMEYELPDLHQLLTMAKASFQKVPTLIEVPCPVNICGDIHGQYGDLMRIFASCGLPFKVRYLFLGDYVDRGRHPLEVIVLLLACKIQFPKFVFLLRGNHELFHINKTYGFAAEIRTRYRIQADAQGLYNHFNEVFAEMPLAAIVAGKILCMHGGLSPELNSLNDIRNIKRPLRMVKGLAQDLLWADPETGAKGFQRNQIRGVSWVFGENAVHEKIKQLGIDMVIRAHQVVEFGYAFFANRKLITVFSAARYHEDLCNFAAVVVIDSHLELSFLQLKPSEYEQQRKKSLYQRQMLKMI